MFHVGRFDPSVEERKAKSSSVDAKKKSGSSKRKVDITAEVQKSDKRKRDHDGDDIHPSKHDDSDDSSSVPSSSDGEDDEPTAQTTLRVIAPSQPIVDNARQRDQKKLQRGAAEDEAMDDFDADYDIIESSTQQRSTTKSANNTMHDSTATRALRLSQLPISEVASSKH